MASPMPTLSPNSAYSTGLLTPAAAAISSTDTSGPSPRIASMAASTRRVRWAARASAERGGRPGPRVGDEVDIAESLRARTVGTMPATDVDEVLALYERYGGRRYDEALSQLAHAEQTATLARLSEASDEVVVAALLHDVGHLLEVAERDGARDRTVDHRHESIGASWLAPLFGPAVTAPIALHVRAKRYLCAVEPSYHDGLSAGSVASLERQGGPLSLEEVAAFETNPGWEGAVALRRWDDQAKVVDLDVAPIVAYLPLLERVSRRALG